MTRSLAAVCVRSVHAAIAKRPHTSSVCTQTSSVCTQTSSVCMHSNQFSMHSNQFSMHSNQFNMHSNQFNMHSNQFNMHALKQNGQLIERQYKDCEHIVNYIVGFQPLQSVKDKSNHSTNRLEVVVNTVGVPLFLSCMQKF